MTQKFRAILADPPWSDVPPGNRPANRETWFGLGHVMSVPKLLSGTIPAADNSLLFLWCRNGNMPVGLKILNTWGFKYVNHMIWVKIAGNNKPLLGMGGSYLRNSHELLLIGRRGSVPRRTTNIPSVLLAPRSSIGGEKPKIIHDLIERIVDGPYLELFARERRPGWSAFGDEIESDVIIPEWVESGT